MRPLFGRPGGRGPPAGVTVVLSTLTKQQVLETGGEEAKNGVLVKVSLLSACLPCCTAGWQIKEDTEVLRKNVNTKHQQSLDIRDDGNVVRDQEHGWQALETGC